MQFLRYHRTGMDVGRNRGYTDESDRGSKAESSGCAVFDIEAST